MAQMRYIRKECGHMNDAVLFTLNEDNIVNVYCLGCLFNRLGLLPCETLSLNEFGKRYGGKK